MIYIHRSDGAYVSFFGMSEAVIMAMLAGQGMTGTVIDQAAYEEGISEVNP